LLDNYYYHKQDGLGDTIRVSLTEDPEFELEPCRTLADIGKAKCNNDSGSSKVPRFTETARNFQSFERRRGELPAQKVHIVLYILY
jgi:(E)-4-hydroxy-3-methylbut-2-enyl-diphosphate synthase